MYVGNIKKDESAQMVVNGLFGLRLSNSEWIKQKRVKWNSLIVSSERWDHTVMRDGFVFIHAESGSLNKDGSLSSRCIGQGKSLFKLGVNGLLSSNVMEQRLSKLDPIDAEDQVNQFKLYQLAEKDDKGKFTGLFKRLPHNLVVKFRGDLYKFCTEEKINVDQDDDLIRQKIKDQQQRYRQDEDLPLFASLRKQVQVLEDQIKNETLQPKKKIQSYKVEFEIIVTIPSCNLLDPYWQIIPKYQDEDVPFLQSFSEHRDSDLRKIDTVHQMLFSKDASQDSNLRQNQIRVMILKKMFESHLKLKKGRSRSEWLNSYDQMG